MKKAIRTAGIKFTQPPSLGLIAMAEDQPKPAYRRDWRSDQATWKPEWMGGMMMMAPQPTITNAEEVRRGEYAARTWGPALPFIREILAQARALIPHLKLAAVPESQLRQTAETLALSASSRIGEQLRDEDREPSPSEARAMCPKAQLRTLRKKAKAARQHAAALFGTVGKGAQYADAFSLARWTERQEAAAAFAAGRVLALEDGTEIPLIDVIEGSRKSALARVHTMAKGMDSEAQAQGWEAIFLTLTLPPEFHPNPSHGQNRYDPTLSPAVADRALASLLDRFRARMAKAKIPTFGTCVKEPHRDGCPHAHLLLYVAPEAVDEVNAMLMALRPETDPTRRVATKLERIDRNRAAPTTYLFKYLMKAMNAPAQGGSDDTGADGDHLTNHHRVRAWASERGLRRFAFWGTHGVQRVWQTLRTRREIPPGAPDQVKAAHHAVHAGEWRTAMHEMGAIRGSGKARIRLAYDNDTNAYGEAVKRPFGIELEGVEGCMPFRQAPAVILSKGEGRAWAEYCAEQKTEELKFQGNRLVDELTKEGGKPAVTVVVSYPRGPSCTDIDGGGVGRTGPSAPKWTIAHKIGDIEILISSS